MIRQTVPNCNAYASVRLVVFCSGLIDITTTAGHNAKALMCCFLFCSFFLRLKSGFVLIYGKHKSQLTATSFMVAYLHIVLLPLD